MVHHMVYQPHRDRMAGGRATLYFSGLALSYRPPMGLAAARMEARALRVAFVWSGRREGR